MLTYIDNSFLRLALRIYFIGTLTLLGLIGSQCCKLAANLDLLNGHSVRLHRMTGWLQARDVVACLWKLRRLPGGLWLGLMMVIASILTLTADLAVALLVHQTEQQGLCDFDTGLVVDWIDPETFIAPPPNGYAALIASNAQIFSYDNGCEIGIFRKVPWTGNSSFCAGWDDILGTWECNDLGQDQSFSVDADDTTIANELVSQNLQYFDWSSTSLTEADGKSTHLVLWSGSNDDTSDSPFDVLASIDLDGFYTDDKIMRTYHCKVTSTVDSYMASINQILSQMHSNTSLSQWVDGLDASLYMGSGTNAKTEFAALHIAQRLNAMTMVQGASNSVQNTTLPGDQPYYGCLVLETFISPAILGLVGFAGFILLVTIFYYFKLLASLGAHTLPRIFRRKSNSSRNIKPVPDSILSWMLQASRENAIGGQHRDIEGMEYLGVPKKESDLRNWSFGVVDAVHGVARMVRTRGAVAPAVEQVHLSVYEKPSR
jgi:hypothetical protein